MKNIWTKINEEIPFYMQKISNKYKLYPVKLSALRTALIGKEFAIIIEIERFDARVLYLRRISKTIEIFMCDNFFAEKYDEDDRKGISECIDASDFVRNSIIIITNGLLNKWENVLLGENDWLDEYCQSKWFLPYTIDDCELKEIERQLDKLENFS